MDKLFSEVRFLCLVVALFGVVPGPAESFKSQKQQANAEYGKVYSEVQRRKQEILARFQSHKDYGIYQQEMAALTQMRMAAFTARAQKLAHIKKAESDARVRKSFSKKTGPSRVIANPNKISSRSSSKPPQVQSRKISSSQQASRPIPASANSVPWRNAVEGGGRISKEWHGFDIPNWVVRFKVVEDPSGRLNNVAYARKGKFVLITDPQRRGGTVRVEKKKNPSRQARTEKKPQPRPPKPPIPKPSGPVRKASQDRGPAKSGVKPPPPLPAEPKPSLESTVLRSQDHIFISAHAEKHYGVMDVDDGMGTLLTYSRSSKGHKEPLFEFGLGVNGTRIRKASQNLIMEVQWLLPYEDNEKPFEKLEKHYGEDLDKILEALSNPGAHAPLGWKVLIKNGVIQKVRKIQLRQSHPRHTQHYY